MRRRILAGILALSGLTSATRYDAASVAARWAIDVYKAGISPLQGREICSFNPTCSQFAKQAIDRYGFFWGVLMAADRLERDNPSVASYLGSYYYQGMTGERVNDPIEDHAPIQAPSFKPRASSYELQAPGPESAIRNPQSAVPANLGFADYLFSEEDYDRAIGEFRRALYGGAGGRARDYARMMIAESYFRKSDFASALVAFQDGMSVYDYQFAELGTARSLLSLGRLDAARHYALEVRDSVLTPGALSVVARSYARQFDFAAAAHALKSGAGDSVLIRAAALNGTGIGRRNVAVGAALSAVLPGLGQAYSGRLGDGIYSFAVVGLASAAGYYYWVRHRDQDPSYVKFGIVAGLGSIFYLSNIYGGGTAARDYNLLQKRRYLERVESALARVGGQPDYRRLIQQ